MTTGVTDLTLSYTDFSATGAVQRFYKAAAYGPRLIMTLVLDRSQSMSPSCAGTGCTQGGVYLPTAVSRFVNVFDQSRSQVALVSFASTAITNVPMTTAFKSSVLAAVNSMLWAGGAFADGGLSNALAINNGITVPVEQNAIKVVVFFSDGVPNIIQNSLTCPDGAEKPWNFGGYSTAGSPVAFFAPNAPYTQAGQDNPYCSTPACCGLGTYPSITGQNVTFTMPHIWLDATNRCIQVANQMRAAGMYVYAIGLTSAGANAPSTNFLQQVANDPASPTFNPAQPAGAAVIASTPDQLESAFQQIAAQILAH